MLSLYIYYNMNLLTESCVAVRFFFQSASLHKRKTFAAILAVVVSSTRTDVETSIGGKETRKHRVQAKIYCNE
jgi:hypothetical protein